MLYYSTRGMSSPLDAAGAIVQGMAPDGGLYVPERLVPVGREELETLAGRPYEERAAFLLAPYLTGFTPEEIAGSMAGAYGKGKFAHPAVAPVKKLAPGLYVLELWHGPTCAFKDMALQLLPRLLPRALARAGGEREVLILVATSGDTGKAALEGFRDVEGTRIVVFYPLHGVSEVQRLQMVTQEGKNVQVVAVEGNFDQAQGGVKEIFADPDIKTLAARLDVRLSSANSINWGRLVPQIVYYFSAYLDLLREGEVRPGEAVNFVVPTGNFGNILAAYYARRMGLPVHRLICAANKNNVLTQFIRTGVYDRRREFYRTLSPSMDILVSSNLERLLFELSGRDAARVRAWMEALQQNGHYRVEEDVLREIQDIFWSDFADDEATLETIRRVYRTYGYLVDPHTAVGMHVYERYLKATGDGHKTILTSTASPFKFNSAVATALIGKEAVAGKGELELLDLLSAYTGVPVPAPLQGVKQRPVRHTLTVVPAEMKRLVMEVLPVSNRG